MQFKIDYRNSDGDISNYFPDFIVKAKNNEIYIVETKGLEDTDVELKRKRLQQWCEDVNKQQKKYTYREMYVTEDDFRKYRTNSFLQLAKAFGE